MNVLIVYDSVVFRAAISDALEEEKNIRIVGKASNGKLALEKLKKVSVDLIILDMEMPFMDGIETIKNIRKDDSKTAILVFSTLTSFGAKKTIEALTHGADDFLAKTVNGEDFDKNVQIIKENLVPKVRQFLPRFAHTSKADQKDMGLVHQENISKKEKKSSLNHFFKKVICIGSSTGGPDALRKLFTQLQNRSGVPILIAQHMPPLFTGQLAKMLDKISPIKVKEAVHGEKVLQNTGYIAPGDFHMTVKNKNKEIYIELNQEERVNNVRPAVDILFSSVAEAYGANSIAVVLTGMGEDGRVGAKNLQAKGAPVKECYC